MIEKVKVTNDQNIVDVAVQEYGSIDGLVSLVKLNGIEIDTEFSVDAELNIETVDVKNASTRIFYKNRNYKVATGKVHARIFDITLDSTFE